MRDGRPNWCPFFSSVGLSLDCACSVSDNASIGKEATASTGQRAAASLTLLDCSTERFLYILGCFNGTTRACAQ